MMCLTSHSLNKKQVFFCALVALLISIFGGCSSSVDPMPERFEPDELSQSEEAPLDVEVAQAFVQGGRLEVMVRITPKTELESERVAVAVAGLADGEVIEEQVQSLAEAVPRDSVDADETIAMRFSLQAQGLSEYQIRASWGVEADELLAANQSVEFSGDVLETAMIEDTEQDAASKIEPIIDDKIAGAPVPELVQQPLVDEEESAEQDPGLVVEVLTVDKEQMECEQSPCDNMLSLNASLHNVSGKAVSDISLGMGLFWVNSGEAVELPEYGASPLENEEVIDLFGLSIPPGEVRKIRVRVDRPVPTVPGGEFRPHLRLVSYLADETVRN